MKNEHKKLALSLLVFLAAGIGPNLFVVAQAGYANLSDLAVSFLFPSIVVVIAITVLGYFIGMKELSNQIIIGLVAGLIGTIGLEVFRIAGFNLGWMPGDLPKLMGVLLLDQFALGPDTTSNIAGWSYHFWNGAAFGIIYSILFGKGKVWLGSVYGFIMGVFFMISPVVIALGVGYFGVDFGIGFPVTVTLAHLAYGTLLGMFVYRWNKKDLSIFTLLKSLVNKK
ncbi:hypothetical protein MNBD_IGNAVI01-429 [hydrothermal vent metagenome]|uniref:Uncharacterized protein n=1 Tax=hydrothermal vent metagenome TaxID=652676 RepID=A0A3B1BB81_9ZZZZ